MTAITPFGGFHEPTFEFLRGIAANNDKAWFTANKQAYKEHFVGAGQSFAESISFRLKALHPGIQVEPRVNGSLFRINRDIRFSKDKTPYKTHLDLFFWLGTGRSRECAGFFFRLAPDAAWIGSGIHGFAKPVLEAYRAAVAGDRGAELEAILADLGDYNIGGQHYKRVPKPHDADHPRAELLKHNALFADLKLDPLPDSVRTAAFLNDVTEHCANLLPLLVWVAGIVESTK
jgi:uncharacterized protein (TIGR02453 family)